ncbi:hypothetical protein H2202_005589 [Exophiala xenobiotica]|nr:hypothetical protein H2202_005589 [Exophiala xenobiotica]KAK5226878.1 hypothetical protein LTR72_002867 [Exophiala xenobiotica]KAK5234378.1 hypothetical protein LTR47_004411 [Exophiala xenobiotica]KAK5254851.1 hypothetical protein LTS06_000990 [Exophiala xenobiotica]KAK5262005.1 hypothetical protein LTR40_001077 [Exophiala xenobiotica]
MDQTTGPLEPEQPENAGPSGERRPSRPSEDPSPSKRNKRTGSTKSPSEMQNDKSKPMRKLRKKSRPSETEDDSSEPASSSSEGLALTDNSSSSESESDAPSPSRKSKKKSKAKAEKVKEKQPKKGKKADKKGKKKAKTTEESSDMDDDLTTLDAAGREKLIQKTKTRLRKLQKLQLIQEDDEESSTAQGRAADYTTNLNDLQTSLRCLNFASSAPSWALMFQLPIAQQILRDLTATGSSADTAKNDVDFVSDDGSPAPEPREAKKKKNKKSTHTKKSKSGSKLEYKRVDQVWDPKIHQYKLTETVKKTGEKVWDKYVFIVRRRFDPNGQYVGTLVDIKSKPLKECLKYVLADVSGISLFEGTPHLDPRTLFLFLEDFLEYWNELLEAAEGYLIHGLDDEMSKQEVALRAKHLELMIQYLEIEFEETKKSLEPLLEKKMITFDLLWALYKPNSIVYAPTYDDHDEPRAFKVELASKISHFSKGVWYNIGGKYLDFNGKAFGMAAIAGEVPEFQGARSITSLECYPIEYHPDARDLKAQLIERGKHFVALKGMNYRFYNGLAFTKTKKGMLRINVEGRIMVDAAVHRRINPNYHLTQFKSKSLKIGYSDQILDDTLSEDDPDQRETRAEDSFTEKKKYRLIKTSDGKHTIVDIDAHPDTTAGQEQPLADAKDDDHSFTEEELLVACPVVFGFSFNEKMWLEFKVSGISEVVFNDQAFESLVLPDNQKSLIKALVSSHAFHPHKSIDDIITGKGRGLVAVLHGPPGTGKTLTAEGIADLLKCPLYMVSAGDLGTDPTRLEKELQTILDIAHSWGAILLLDEADVFLQERALYDIHRNALVSIFLRLLEYFQGILFLTTNRVRTFDSAFISRIHLSLQFQNLNTKAKRSVWKIFIDRVKSQEGMEVGKITEADYTDLARRDVNGRQIKNLIRAAHALAIHENVALTMQHIRRVIDVAESFDVDMKGGSGYSEAMKSYT